MRGHTVQVRQHDEAPWEITAFFQLTHDALNYVRDVNTAIGSTCEARLLPGTFSQDMAGATTIHVLH